MSRSTRKIKLMDEGETMENEYLNFFSSLFGKIMIFEFMIFEEILNQMN